MKRRVLPHVGWLALSVVLVLSALVPIAYVAAPHVDRYLRLEKLTSPDVAERELALNYVIRRAGQDPAVAAGAVARFGEAPDDTIFLQIASALDRAGVWQREIATDDNWLRWIDILSRDKDETARVMAAQLCASMHALADDPRMRSLLEDLIDDPLPDVRFNAMAAAAELHAAAGEPVFYERLIATRTRDPETKIARHAWIILGWIDPIEGFTADWRATPPPVAEAILWTATRTNPDRPAAATEALTDANASPIIRAAAAYALSLSPTPEAVTALLDLVQRPPETVPQQELVSVWRSLLVLPRPDLSRDPLTRLELAMAPYADDAGPGSPLEPLTTAAVYRFGVAGELGRPRDDPFSVLVRLATVEGQPDASMEWPIVGGTPDLLRVMTTRIARTPNPEAMLSPLASPEPAMRDLAAVVAAERLTSEQNAALIDRLLGDYSDDAKRGGAILAGLTGQRLDALRERADFENNWSTQQVMRLGLWMAGTLPEFGQTVDGLVLREDVPVTTVLLAMLEHGGDARYRALEFLLNPRGEPVLDLIELLDRQRWWYVLRDYLPEPLVEGAPFWPWADADLEAFQVDVLRDGFLVNAYRIRNQLHRDDADQAAPERN